MKREGLVTVLLTLLVIVSIFVASEFIQQSLNTSSGTGEAEQEAVKATIVRMIQSQEIDNQDSEAQGEEEWETQFVDVKIHEGPHKGETIRAENIIDPRLAHSIVVEKDDSILVYVNEDNRGNALDASIIGYSREIYLYILIGTFALLLIAVGALKGLKAIITLAITIAIIIKILLPLILLGYNPLWVSIISCAVIIAITLIIVSGINKKTLSAIIGTSGGVFAAGSIALIVGTLSKLTGLGDEEAQMLFFIPQQIELDFKGLLFAAILIGTLGAVMDVGMSIASSMTEIEKAKPDITSRELIKSGMNIGKDIMGTMSNTLILAYTGGSLHLMLLLMAYNVPFMEIINQDIIATEVVRAISGSIGLILSIPLTAVIAGTFGRKHSNLDLR
jgi:uncharacterized membrane protein